MPRKKNLRLLTTDGLPDPRRGGLAFRQVAGGFLVQDRDAGAIAAADLKVVTKRAADRGRDGRPAVRLDGRQACEVERHRLCEGRRDRRHRRGPDEPGRSAPASPRARRRTWPRRWAWPQPLTVGSVVASDAFFPFPDGLLAAAEAGATAVIQPGGSMRDDEVIAAADAAGLAMVFTGQRHFRH